MRRHDNVYVDAKKAIYKATICYFISPKMTAAVKKKQTKKNEETLWYCVKRAKRIVDIFRQPDSLIIPVFLRSNRYLSLETNGCL